MKDSTEVTLVGGEKVQMEIGTICNADQVCVRMGPNLIAGVVKPVTDGTRPWQGVYFWQKVGEVYVYLGDMTLREQEDGVVLWKMLPWVHNGDDFEQRCRMHLVSQHETQNTDCFTGGQVSMLSAALGALKPVHVKKKLGVPSRDAHISNA
jgi:hypothetical protein